MKVLAFDIETGPLPDNELMQIADKFDAKEVKTGNIKDPEKIAEKIKNEEAKHFDNIKKTAALKAQLARILAIGFLWENEDQELEYLYLMADQMEERDILKVAWKTLMEKKEKHFVLAGHYIKGFDLPFMMRRSFKLGVKIPLLLQPTRNRYWPTCFFDTAEVWSLNETQSRIKLDDLCKFLKIPGKIGTGDKFAELLKESPKEAQEYLFRDLECSKAVAEKLIQTLY